MSRIFNTLILHILILAPGIPLHAQFQQHYYMHRQLDTSSEKQLDLAVRAAGFFNNNEFFDTDVEGYTLIGNYFQPVLNYNFSDVLSAKLGGHFLKYHGQEGFAQIRPFFSLSYRPLENIIFTAGSFNKGGNLKLTEPLYKFENQFTHLAGNGIMINYTGEIWEAETWLDWRTFIEPGDPFREEFVFGHSGKIRILGNENYQLKIPLIALAEHKGGQINTGNDPVETRYDLGTGLELSLDISAGIFESFRLRTDAYFEQASSSGTDGNALFAFGEFRGELISAGLGYFMEEDWESILGEPLYFSRAQIPGETGLRKEYLLFKTGLGKRIGENSSFIIRFEGYYDLEINRFQYTYGLHIIVDEWIRLFQPGM